MQRSTARDFRIQLDNIVVEPEKDDDEEDEQEEEEEQGEEVQGDRMVHFF